MSKKVKLLRNCIAAGKPQKKGKTLEVSDREESKGLTTRSTKNKKDK